MDYRHYPHCLNGRFEQDFLTDSEGAPTAIDRRCSECSRGESYITAPFQYCGVEHVKSSAELEPALVQDIVQVVGEAFGVAPTDTAEHISGDLILMAYEQKKPVGFACLVYGSPQEVFSDQALSPDQGGYFAAAAVAERYQGQGVYQMLNEERLDEVLKKGQNLIFTRTQNPHVEAGILRLLNHYRSVGCLRSFQLRRTLIPGCYGSMLTEKRPTTEDSGVQKAYSRLDYAAGDAYVLEFFLETNIPSPSLEAR